MADAKGNDDIKAKMREALERKQAHLHPDDSAGAKSKAIRDQVNGLCREIRTDARPLVDAFGIPDEVLRAPDGRHHG